MSILKAFAMLSQSRWKNNTVLVMWFQREGALQRSFMDASKDLSCVGIQRWLEWRKELLES